MFFQKHHPNHKKMAKYHPQNQKLYGKKKKNSVAIFFKKIIFFLIPIYKEMK
jgi:hypothetical protein